MTTPVAKLCSKHSSSPENSSASALASWKKRSKNGADGGRSHQQQTTDQLPPALQAILPSGTIPDVYTNGSNEEQAFIQNLALLLPSFFKKF
ncbi:hypothetical protein E2562_016760 [Oryza meyeriana var. granulata]|uniref:Uncharacterized protein n=1 Tax=Oryza meyeriana var. granulata TaxID=110450 RepID=A0A6G1BLB9_9ORYZ|nr:hypothetical protein E2562_016760 [Oryza meyeriana var. granulata]